MAELKVTIPENSQNIAGVVTIRAPLERGDFVASGMEGGWRQAIDALGRLVEK